MRFPRRTALAFALTALATTGAHASTAYGDLNNFDAVNDTGVETHGFEIEIDGARSTDVTYTYDWNHYGPPKITEDLSNPALPKVFIRYESAKNPDGSWAAYTAIPPAPIGPTGGHACTDPSVNQGCEHFGVGYYGAPSAISYNWLVDGGGVLVHHSSPVLVGTPTFNYVPPAPAQPAVVVAVIPAPVAPIPVAKQFGDPSFVKVIKTTTHSANVVHLQDLVSDDKNGDGLLDWQNGEPSEVESEFYLLQTNNGGNPAKQQLAGAGDGMGDGSEKVTRRYEFYKYGAAPDTIDGETGEAMCDSVQPTTDPNDPLYQHGVGNHVAVTDPNGDTYYVNCEAQVVVGDYIGAQMAGFDAALPLGLIDHLQDGDKNAPYTPRSLIVGGNTPYFMTLTAGNLPPGMSLGTYTDPQSGDVSRGVLFGTPTAAGVFNFTVEASDVDNTVVSKAYTLTVTGDGVVTPQHWLVVSKFNSGSGTVSGNGIDCGATCEIQLDEGSIATLSATPAVGSRFGGWSGDCAGNGGCQVTMSVDRGVGADFIQQYLLSVSKAGSGSGTVSGNGIACGATCSIALDTGTAVSLSATASAGSVFTGWSGDCTGTGTCDTTMSAARSVTASFSSNVSLKIADVSTTEGDTGTKKMTFTVSLSKAAASNVTVDVATANVSATAGSDYTALNLVGFTIPSGSLSKTFTVTVINDLAVESNETFQVNLSNAVGAAIADGQAIGTIIDNDNVVPVLHIADVSATEGDTGTKTMSFKVTMSKAVASDVTMDVATADVTATAGSDYLALNLAGFTIPSGATSKTFAVTVKNDLVNEGNETFQVNLSNAVGATIADDQAIGTIIDNDNVVPALHIADVSATEGDTGTKTMTFMVTMSKALASDVTLDVATADGTATAGSDYVALNLVGLTIPSGATSKSFTVTVKNDLVNEGNETFQVNLGNAVGATLADNQAIGTIIDNDNVVPTLTIADASTTEGNTGTKTMTFTVKLSKAFASDVTMDVATADVTATAGSDYKAVALAGFTIPSGSLSKTVTVTVINDLAVEGNETFQVNLSNPVGATIADGQAIGTIIDND